MKHSFKIVALMIALAAAPTLWAQDEEVPDSVLVMGTVRNFNQWTPMEGCTVLLKQGNDTVASTLSEEDGSFAFSPVPSGVYSLHVSREFSFYRADLALADNAELNIAVDTIKHLTLRPVNISEARPIWSDMKIVNPDDSRLWNFSGQMGSKYRDASVGDPEACNPYIALGSHFDPSRWFGRPMLRCRCKCLSAL